MQKSLVVQSHNYLNPYKPKIISENMGTSHQSRPENDKSWKNLDVLTSSIEHWLRDKVHTQNPSANYTQSEVHYTGAISPTGISLGGIYGGSEIPFIDELKKRSPLGTKVIANYVQHSATLLNDTDGKRDSRILISASGVALVHNPPKSKR